LNGRYSKNHRFNWISRYFESMVFARVLICVISDQILAGQRYLLCLICLYLIISLYRDVARFAQVKIASLWSRNESGNSGYSYMGVLFSQRYNIRIQDTIFYEKYLLRYIPLSQNTKIYLFVYRCYYFNSFTILYFILYYILNRLVSFY